MNNVPLTAGSYSLQLMITEESFHADGEGDYTGNWAAAMAATISYIIQDS